MDFSVNTCRNDAYIVRSRPKGYVLLINIETFDNGFRQRRYGSEQDYRMLKEMWEYFGYEVKEYCNLNLKDFLAAVTNFAMMPEHRNVDSAIVFIMSHGKEDENNPHAVRITTKDDQYVSSDWIKERFSSANCPLLVNKPKIIFFQACRGSLRDQGVCINEAAGFMNGGLTLVGNKLVPVMSDLLLVYPTLPGYVSQRDTLCGAWFVQECISVFTSDSPHTDLLTMLNRVDQRVRKKCIENIGAYFQVVYFESWGFNRKMYFGFQKAKNKKQKNADTLTCSFPLTPFNSSTFMM